MVCTLFPIAEPPTSQSVCVARVDPRTSPQRCPPTTGMQYISVYTTICNKPCIINPIKNISLGCHIHESHCFTEAKQRAGVPFLFHKVLEVDCNGMKYLISDHSITVRIPEGAVAMGKKVVLEIGVTLYGPFSFSRNTQPISPIIWLCFLKEDTELLKPFQVILPHFLLGVTDDEIQHHQIAFAKAHHNDYEDVQMTYEFHQCDTKPMFTTSENRSYGILETKHNCFYCIQANKTPELAMKAGYCLVRFEDFLRQEIHFCVIYFLDTCVEVRHQFNSLASIFIEGLVMLLIIGLDPFLTFKLHMVKRVLQRSRLM